MGGQQFSRRSAAAHSQGAPLRFSTVLVFLFGLSLFAQQQGPATPQTFNGTYAQLRPAQKKLIDEWYGEYNKMTGENLPPSDYDQLSLSTRTTFEAVTHALLTTKLTDKQGQSLGNALDLVEAIEAVNGKVPRARGDLQFRVYVMLKPNAVQTLKDSSEFFRDRDNTVYHHGYPLNYRQDGGAPSIQYSIAKDGRHADIDVDYRSSGIPVALFNGHLTASNSDVRAGNNTQRHVQRWNGLTDWWRNLFGLADSSEDVSTSAEASAGEIPPIPRQGDGKLEDAVQDFLSSWLVQQKPELSAAYLSGRSFSCLEEYGPQSGKEINAGVAPYLAARDMAATNRLMGKPAALGNAIAPARLDDPSLKLVKQRYSGEFSLYDVPNGVAASFECDPARAFQEYDQSRVAGSKNKSGRYFGSVFKLKPQQGKGDTVTLIWTREGKYWKVVAWDVEPEDAKPGEVPDTRPAPRQSVAAEAPIPGDADFLQTSNKFLRSWLLKDDFNAAAGYFSQQCFECAGSYASPGETVPTTPDGFSAYLRNALMTIEKDVGPAQHLSDAIEPVEPDHTGLKTVSHTDQDAYAVVAVPDSLADLFECQKPMTRPTQLPPEDTANNVYGNYYAMLFAIRTPGEHAAALTLLWNKQGGQWKIVSYQLAVP